MGNFDAFIYDQNLIYQLQQGAILEEKFTELSGIIKSHLEETRGLSLGRSTINGYDQYTLRAEGELAYHNFSYFAVILWALKQPYGYGNKSKDEELFGIPELPKDDAP